MTALLALIQVAHTRVGSSFSVTIAPSKRGPKNGTYKIKHNNFRDQFFFLPDSSIKTSGHHSANMLSSCKAALEVVVLALHRYTHNNVLHG